MNKIKALSHVLIIFQLSGCVTFDPDRDADKFESEWVSSEIKVDGPSSAVKSEINVEGETTELPRASLPDFDGTSNSIAEIRFSDGGKILANFRNMPLPEFVNEALGKRLGMSYLLDPALGDSEDLVTLSLTDPLKPREFFRIVKSVLTEYGVSVDRDGEIVKVVLDQNASIAERPLLVTGRALPDIPVTHRPVFVNYTLKVLRPPQVRGMLRQLYPDTALFIGEIPDFNSITLRGSSDAVREAVSALAALDRPLMNGKHSLAYQPVFMEPAQLANDLVKVLSTEGYAATTAPPYGSVIILPFDEQQRILIFANNSSVAGHVLDWAKNLDEGTRKSISEGFFSYEARNITANHIAKIVSSLEGGGSGGGSESIDRNSGSTADGLANDSEGRQRSEIGTFLGGKLVVDGNRNVIFFKGSGTEWGRIRRLIEQVDLPVPMVLIDLLLVEITLSEGQNSGFDWLFKSSVGSDMNLSGGTLGRLNQSGSGMSLVLDSAGETRAILNAFYQNDKASIRSSPKLLVKSGETAQIEVGNEIPILTSNAQSIDAANAPIVQTVEYRKTGVLLEINPVVQASGLVDLLISQELSESQAVGALGSPIILQRSLQTALSIKDGGSILLGGLISDNQISGAKGLPVLSKVPLIRKLVSVDADNSARTELLMLVSTFVLKNHDRAVELTKNLRERFQGELGQ